MQKVFFVVNGDLKVVNEELRKGGIVKSISPIAEEIGAYGYTSNGTLAEDKGFFRGDVFAYVVIEYKD